MVPSEFQGAVMAGVNRRKGIIVETEARDDYASIHADVPLNDMFGYSTEIRSLTQGKGEFSMEYKNHMPVLSNVQEELALAHLKKTNPAAVPTATSSVNRQAARS